MGIAPPMYPFRVFMPTANRRRGGIISVYRGVYFLPVLVASGTLTTSGVSIPKWRGCDFICLIPSYRVHHTICVGELITSDWGSNTVTSSGITVSASLTILNTSTNSSTSTVLTLI